MELWLQSLSVCFAKPSHSAARTNAIVLLRVFVTLERFSPARRFCCQSRVTVTYISFFQHIVFQAHWNCSSVSHPALTSRSLFAIIGSRRGLVSIADVTMASRRDLLLAPASVTCVRAAWCENLRNMPRSFQGPDMGECRPPAATFHHQLFLLFTKNAAPGHWPPPLVGALDRLRNKPRLFAQDLHGDIRQKIKKLSYSKTKTMIMKKILIAILIFHCCEVYNKESQILEISRLINANNSWETRSAAQLMLFVFLVYQMQQSLFPRNQATVGLYTGIVDPIFFNKVFTKIRF